VEAIADHAIQVPSTNALLNAAPSPTFQTTLVFHVHLNAKPVHLLLFVYHAQ